jgi:hypothetical protein
MHQRGKVHTLGMGLARTRASKLSRANQTPESPSRGCGRTILQALSVGAKRLIMHHVCDVEDNMEGSPRAQVRVVFVPVARAKAPAQHTHTHTQEQRAHPGCCSADGRGPMLALIDTVGRVGRVAAGGGAGSGWAGAEVEAVFPGSGAANKAVARGLSTGKAAIGDGCITLGDLLSAAKGWIGSGLRSTDGSEMRNIAPDWRGSAILGHWRLSNGAVVFTSPTLCCPSLALLPSPNRNERA